MLIPLHLLDQAQHLFKLLGVFLDVSRKDRQHVEVLIIDPLQLSP
jgi:hypothetical protein